ncbi:helix-turn-helix domain-containing protein [Amycolatopsis jiangsuensis]|uniref:Transcriptional regulator with XRE-family HTH domain n=1 Tax=Amycolatopsis jiangsuensis TaxID=1181879 RepID=A0A840ITY7_9PSEU|nr:helix-turn-helix transcriptional regulator [Amycolatopsis jiangsuensis]MBB4684618.1 transcriptional regulator with XRE-family HTH domain [Amycolatopsis jiangsuensis]
MSQPSPALASRLRALRKESWPGVVLTQRMLADAFGVSNGLLSSWENTGSPVAPPPARLDAYATFFATHRSVDGEGVRVLPVDQLTEQERELRSKLLTELTGLRGSADELPAATGYAIGNLWRFPPEQDVVIVVSELPDTMRTSYADPASPDYARLLRYGDPDALIELYGHIRACTPTSKVSFRTASRELLRPEEYTAHLVLLGGVDWNPQTRELLDRIDAPVRQKPRETDGSPGGAKSGHFEATRSDGSVEVLGSKMSGGTLVEDVTLFYRGPNPLNRKRTVTVCNGMHARGTLGAVRALTDPRFRDRNQSYLDQRFAGAASFSILSRVPVFNNQGLTPDWTVSGNRLHEWSDVDTHHDS